MKPPVDDAGQTKPNHTRSGSLDWPPCDVMFVWTICPGGQAFSLVAGDGKAVFHSFLAAALDFIFGCVVAVVEKKLPVAAGAGLEAPFACGRR